MIGSEASRRGSSINNGNSETTPGNMNGLESRSGKPHLHHQGISDIKWDMLDKKRYLPLTVVNMLAVRTLLYPLTVVRTRLQVQARGSLYTGTFNALGAIAKYEGPLALFKGFWVNSFQLFPHVIYITVYEVKKNHLNTEKLSFCYLIKIISLRKLDSMLRR
jgi:hypothetical protein